MQPRVFSACFLSCLLLAAAGQAKDLHVAPTGTPAGDGTAANPWDLATCLSHAGVAPGDTVWLHGGDYVGSYVGNLTGTASNPIVVRSAPGEWARIDGNGSADPTFEFHGAWTVYRDFEITNTDTNRWDDRPGADVYGPNLKLVNLVIHDTGGNGFWSSAVDSEIYGCLIYHNGFDASDRGHGHEIYMQNATGTKKITDNVIFGGYSFGIHAYTEGGAIQGFDIVGNVWFNAGVASSVSGHKDDCLIGGLQPADRILLEENYAWAIGGDTRSVQLGYSSGMANGTTDLRNNYFIGALKIVGTWSSITMTGNTLCTVTGVDTSDFPSNTYLTVTPNVPEVFVRPNAHEPGRAHVIVYNWGEADSQPVDLSGVLSPGDAFEIRNAQDYFAAPVVTGTFDGSPVSVPQNNLTPAQPIGTPGSYDPQDQTGSLFNVFVVRKTTSSCSSAAQCGDNDPCTTDECTQSACVHTPISGCCQSDGDCDDGNACTASSCDGNVCTHEPVSGCCSTDDACGDNNACTVDTCAVATGTCSNGPAPGGCAVDTDCDDGDPCTLGRCTGGCACEFERVDGCDPDPADGGSGGSGGSGGPDGASGSGAVSAEAGGVSSSEDDSGCGCSLPGRGPDATIWWAMALAGIVLGRRLRTRIPLRCTPR